MNYAGELRPTKAGRSAALALLLAVTLLLCHGVLGAHHQLHQVSSADVSPTFGHPTHGGVGHMDAHSVEQHPSGVHDGCFTCVAYAAVLLVVSLRVLLWLLNVTLAWTRKAEPSLSSLGLAVPVPHQARGPTLPALQVFRL